MKEKIISFLKSRGVYDDIDDILIDELIYNIELSKEAKKDIAEKGIIPKGKFMQSPSIHTYNQCLKNIISLSTKLSIVVKEKKNIKNIEVDDLDDLING